MSDIEVSDSLFGLRWNANLVDDVVSAFRDMRRVATAHTKGRSDVRGGGKKPWRQKGTGRARHGSTRSPIWVGGGTTHGPTSEKQYGGKLNKKVRRKALAIVLSKKLKDGEVIFIESADVAEAKTKLAKGALEKIAKGTGIEALAAKGGRTLIVIKESHPETIRAFRNIPYVTISEARNINAETALLPKYVILTKEAPDAIHV